MIKFSKITVIENNGITLVGLDTNWRENLATMFPFPMTLGVIANVVGVPLIKNLQMCAKFKQHITSAMCSRVTYGEN